MDDDTQNFVRDRANHCCEYRRIPQRFFVQLFHIEHIIARSHGGSNTLANLALSWMRCNLHEGPNLSGIDPETGKLTRLFNPRDDAWQSHFELSTTGEITGKTDIGRTTAYVLNMNDEQRIKIRRALLTFMGEPNP